MARKPKPNQPSTKAAPAKQAGNLAGKNAGRGLIWRALRWVLVLGIWAGVAVAGLVAWYAYDLPDLERLETPARRASVTLLAADGTELASYGDLHGGAVPFQALPPYLVQAVVATEDRRFFDHPGIDVLGMLRATLTNLRAGAVRQGGSTITQQLAKNLFLTPTRTLRRKVQELLLALWLEARFSKQQIFALYINRVYFGSRAFGIEAAARRYFAKPARRIGLHEAATLAGLLKAPSRYSPARSPRAAKARAAQVLANMVAAGFLSPADARHGSATPLRFRLQRRTRGGRYFGDWLAARTAGYIGHPGRDLIIRTTLDVGLQAIAERRLAAHLARAGGPAGAGQAALVALAPDGAVRAMVGGRNYAKSQFNRATQALRQPGSAFKLFVYLAGLEAGLGPDRPMSDAPIRIGKWRPRNYDGRYRGEMSVAHALAKSVNTVAVRIAQHAGIKNVIDAARRLGITTKLPSHPSLALGAGEVTLLELTAAYGVLANRGYAVWPHGIIEVRDGAGRVLYRRSGSGAGRVVGEEQVRQLTAMLRGVVENGTGRNARLSRPAAGKTGTSQDARDAWFVGFSAELVAGVWVGNDDSRPMKRVTGGGLPARLWREFMTRALKGVPVHPLVGE